MTPEELLAQGRARQAQRNPAPAPQPAAQDQSVIADLGQRAAQVNAGLLDFGTMFTSSPAAEGYIEPLLPGIATSLYGLASLGSEWAFDTKLPGGDRALELSAAAGDQVNDIVGAEYPQDWVDTVLRIGPTAAIPMPGAAIGAIAKLPAAARLPAQLMSPLNPGMTAAGRAGFTAAPVLAGDALQGAVIPEYQSIAGMALGGGDAPQPEPPPTMPPAPAPGSDPAATDIHALLQAGRQRQLVRMGEARMRQRDDDDDDWMQKAALGAIGVLGAYGAMRFIRGRAAQLRAARLQTHPTTPLPNTRETGPLARAYAGGVDVTEPISASARRAGASEAQLDELARLRATSANSIGLNAKTDHWIRTGQLPEDVRVNGQVLKTEPLQRLQNDVGFASEQTRRNLDLIRHYGNALDRRANAARISVAKGGPLDIRPTFSELSTPQLQRLYNQARLDPIASALADRYQQMYKTLMDYAHARGYITDKAYVDLRQNQTRYNPEYHLEERERLVNRVFSKLEPNTAERNSSLVEEFMHRTNDPTAPNTSRFMDTVASADRYAQSVIRAVEQNSVRQKYFKAVGAKPTKNGDIEVRTRNGVERYRVTDPSIKAALEFNPPAAFWLINAARRLFQAMNTGPARPFFSFTSGYLYDMPLIAINAPRGRGYTTGFLPSVISDFIADPTFFARAPYGTVRMVKDYMTRAVSNMAYESLAKNGVMVQVYGQAGIKAIADAGARAYARSATNLMHRHGIIGSPSYAVKDTYGNITRIKDYAPVAGGHSTKLDRWMRGYLLTLEAVRNGPKTQFFAQNFARLSEKSRGGTGTRPSKQALDRLIADTKNIASDPTRMGGNRTIQGILSLIPYGNVMVQGAFRLGEAVTTPKFATSVGLMVLANWWLQKRTADMGDEYRQHYYEELTPEQRDLGPMWYHEGESPDRAVSIPIPQEWRPQWAMITAMVDAINGFSSGTFALPESRDIQDYVARALDVDTIVEGVEAGARGLTGMVGSVTPPLAGLAANLAGYRVRGDPMNLGITEIRDSYVEDPGRPVANLLHQEWFEAALESVMGAVAGDMLTAVRTFERTMHNPQMSYDEAFANTGEQVLADLLSPFRPSMNTVWSHTRPLSTYTEQSRELFERTSAIQRIEALRNEYLRGGAVITNRSSPRFLAGYQGPDPLPVLEQRIVEFLHPGLQDIKQRFGPQLNDLRQTADRLQNGTDRHFGEEATQLRNEAIRRMNQVTDDYLAEIEQLEAAARQFFQLPELSINDFNPTAVLGQ